MSSPLSFRRLPVPQVQLGLAYTLRNQVLVYVPFQLYLREDQLRLTGEMGYYRYNYFFYGVGNDFVDNKGENYGVNYPRLRLNALRRLGTHQLAGLCYAFDDWQVYDQEAAGLLAGETVTGSTGSVTSALGPLWQWDSRDHVFFPTSGWWAEAAVLANGPALGASQSFTKWSLDVRKYWSPKADRVWAGQLYLEGNSGEPPFNQLALLGGTRLLRGYYEGRFRDRQLAAAQVEYRFSIRGRFAGVAFEIHGSGGGWFFDGCSGDCPGCFQRPWCNTGNSAFCSEDGEAGKMHLIDELKDYVSASPQSLRMLRRL